MKEIWTVRKIFNWSVEYFTKKQIPEPRLSAEILLAYLLNMERFALYLNFDKPLTQDETLAYRKIVERRLKKEPIEYITGYTDFWKSRLKVTPDVLIPRKDTETLVETALNLLRERMKPPYKVADIGCGSGAIAIALAAELNDSVIFATDISEEALKVAIENSILNNVSEKIIFRKGDLFEPLRGGAGFSLIASNPPYIAPGDSSLDESVRLYEPHKAIFSENGELYFHKKLVDKACDFLDNGGYLIVETGFKQGGKVKEIFKNSGKYTEVNLIKDYAGVDRVVYGRKA